MKDGFIRVGCASFVTALTNVEENAKNIIEYINKASEENVHVLTFPELCLTGYTIEDLLYQKRVF